MTNIEVRSVNNGIKISGIVHKIGTKSKMLRRKGGQFIEQFSKEAWEDAIIPENEVRLLVNHDTKQSYATTKNGTLQLHIDGNDVKMDAVIYDKELAEEIRAYGDGFSFGFAKVDESWEDKDGYSIRSITKAIISEVSILVNNRPAYGGTLVEVRSTEDGPDYIEVAETNLIEEVRAMDFESDEFKLFADKLFEVFKDKQKELEETEQKTEEAHESPAVDETDAKEVVLESTTEESTEEKPEGEVTDEGAVGAKEVVIENKQLEFDYDKLVNMLVEKLKPVEQTPQEPEAEKVEETKADEIVEEVEDKKDEEQIPEIDEDVQKFLQELQNQKEVIEDEA